MVNKAHGRYGPTVVASDKDSREYIVRMILENLLAILWIKNKTMGRVVVVKHGDWGFRSQF